MSKKKKMKFEVMDNETISECLDRMDREGYRPVRRMEKPIFAEGKKGRNVNYEPVKQQIIFEGALKESEQ